MKRQPKERVFFLRRDRNKEILFRAGQHARDCGRKLSDVPELRDYLTSSLGYIAELQRQWVDGWLQRDNELRTAERDLKGTVNS